MLYHAIKRLEQKFKEIGFNQKFFSADDLLIWLENLGVLALPDKGIEEALLLKHKENLLIFYNPYLHPDQLKLALGHELGHILLGHAEYAEVLFSKHTFFSKTGLEKDVGIIGFLCWVPTWFLKKLDLEERLSPEELAWELNTCDTEYPLIWELCKARIRIYKALKRLQLLNSLF
jgi:hypothetical protein